MKLLLKRKRSRMAKDKKMVVRKSKTLDEKYLGPEPKFSTVPTNIELIGAFNWFNYFYGSDQAKKYAKDHLKRINKSLMQKIGPVPDYEFRPSGWILRLVDMGNDLGEVYTKALAQIEKLAEKYKPIEKPIEKKPEVVVTVQDRIRAKTNYLIEELEAMVDQVMTGQKVDTDIYAWLQANETKQGNASAIVKYYEPWLSEFESDSKDPVFAFLKKIVDDANRIAINQRRVRKPRTKKAKSKAQVVSSLKFKLEDQEYKLRSIDPLQVPGAKELWTFNVKKRILSVFRSETGLTVKGTTLQEFDSEKSISKKIRKPDEVLKAVLSNGKVANRRLIEGIKAKNLDLTGRINSDTILLMVK